MVTERRAFVIKKTAEVDTLFRIIPVFHLSVMGFVIGERFHLFPTSIYGLRKVMSPKHEGLQKCRCAPVS